MPEQRSSTPQNIFSRTRREKMTTMHDRVAPNLPSIESNCAQDTIFAEVLATSFGK